MKTEMPMRFGTLAAILALYSQGCVDPLQQQNDNSSVLAVEFDPRSNLCTIGGTPCPNDMKDISQSFSDYSRVPYEVEGIKETAIRLHDRHQGVTFYFAGDLIDFVEITERPASLNGEMVIGREFSSIRGVWPKGVTAQSYNLSSTFNYAIFDGAYAVIGGFTQEKNCRLEIEKCSISPESKALSLRMYFR